MNKKRFSRRQFLELSATVTAGIAASQLASCVPSAKPATEAVTAPTETVTAPTETVAAPTETATAVAEVTKAPTEITFVNIAGHTTSQLFQTKIAEFQQKSGIKVNFEPVPYADMRTKEIAEMMAKSGRFDLIDVVNVWLGEYAMRGWIDSLDSYVGADKDFHKEDFATAAMNIYQFNGKQMGIPFMFGPRAMYYRTDLIPSPPATRDEWLKVAKEVTKGDVFGTTLEGKREGYGSVEFEEFLWQNGGQTADANGMPVFNSDAGVAAMQLMYDLLFTYKIVPPDAMGLWETDYVNLFQNGKIATINIWPWMYAKAADPTSSKVTDKFNVTVEPAATRSISFVGTTGLCIPSSSKNKEAAWQLIKYLTGVEFQVELGEKWGVEMANKTAVQKIMSDLGVKGKYLEAHLRAGETAQGHPIYPWWSQTETVLADALGSVLTKQMTPKQALDNAAKQIADAAKGWTT